jgi:hypothetical protein
VAVALLAWLSAPAAAQSSDPACAEANGAQFTVSAAGDTNGQEQWAPGTRVTISLTTEGGNTATSASWALVGSSTGVPVWAGPAGLNSSLSYTIPGPGAAAAAGFYIYSINGTATITFACVAGPVAAVPTLSTTMTTALAGLLGLAACAGLQRMRRRRA